MVPQNQTAYPGKQGRRNADPEQCENGDGHENMRFLGALLKSLLERGVFTISKTL